MEDIPCESHIMSGSLRENQEKYMEALKTFVDANALDSRCHWRASDVDKEKADLLRDLETLKEVLENMKEIYMNFLSDRNHLLELTKIYHHALRREEDEVEMIASELEDACVSLESTQKDIQE